MLNKKKLGGRGMGVRTIGKHLGSVEIMSVSVRRREIWG